MTQEADVLRIIIATDNHLGVWENDEARKDDSFTSFEEVFEIAAQQNADLVLLGGDLFHDNKPSRQTVVKAMDILSRHCLNDRPIAFQVISDETENFTTGLANFHNPNVNIGLPVFTIHGNHDDPAGSDNLSAVDILSTASLVNYFGKANITESPAGGAGKIRIAPVLLQKGATKLALYGLGNVRDERLSRLFNTPNAVEWVRPAEVPAFPQDEWFNVFVLHQNRVAHSQSTKNYVREGHLGNFLDLVVWGHEHECLADPWPTAGSEGQFHVMQPGSSVATALSEGEAKKKHVVLLEVAEREWRTIKFPLETVRPFAFDSLTLEGNEDLDPEDPKTVSEFLTRKVDAMLAKAVRGRQLRTPDLPLVRLRVDYTGFSTINTQRFGQRFVGKVANPQDIVMWHKAAVRKTKAEREAAAAAAGERNETVRQAGTLDEVRIEELIARHLDANLEILQEAELSEALHDFVDKGLKDALADAVAAALQETQEATATAAAPDGLDEGMGDVGEGDGTKRGKKLTVMIEAVAKKRKTEVDLGVTWRRAAELAAEAEDGDNAAGPSRQRSALDALRMPPPAPVAGRGRGRGRGKTASPAAAQPKARARMRAPSPRVGDLSSEEDDELPAAPRGRGAAAAKPRASTRPAAATARQRLASAQMKNAVKDDRSGDEEFDEDDDDSMLVGGGGVGGRRRQRDEISKSDDEDEEMEELEPEERAPPRVGGGGRGRRGAANPGAGTQAEPISLVDSDDDEEEAPITTQTQRRGTVRSQMSFDRLAGGRGTGGGRRWGSIK